ncbi:MAG: hypothetical protein RBS80_09695 [Thermoguttaceae bacterium]|jgi:hypothetical protein|nr:hypothetical protein [Thermoguttaceae bacterium]
MHLDRTQIAIRPRSYVDILDLSLCVARAFGRPLLLAWAVGAVPAILLNGILLWGLVDPSGEGDWPILYMFWMAFLVVWEMPVATAFITLYLGEATFGNRPGAGQLIAGFWRALPQLFWYQVALRALLTLPWLSWPVLYAGWPYLSEVVLLERNPMTSRRKDGTTTWRRSAALHRAMTGELFGRWFLACCIGGLLIASLWLSVWFFRWHLFNLPEWSAVMFTVFLPVIVWLVVGFFAVVRFLSYLDLRIRREGWDIELMLRAEGNRISERLE